MALTCACGPKSSRLSQLSYHSSKSCLLRCACEKQAIAIAAQNDGVLCDAVASNCVNNRGQPSPRLSEWWVPTAAPEAGCPFLDGFWKDYKPQEALPCPPSIALPAFVPPVIAPAAAVPSSYPVITRRTPQSSSYDIHTHKQTNCRRNCIPRHIYTLLHTLPSPAR